MKERRRKEEKERKKRNKSIIFSIANVEKREEAKSFQNLILLRKYSDPFPVIEVTLLLLLLIQFSIPFFEPFRLWRA